MTLAAYAAAAPLDPPVVVVLVRPCWFPTVPNVKGTHTHYWKVEPPNGTTSVGRCLCGREQEFVNGSLPYESAKKLDDANRRRLGLPPSGNHKKRPREASRAWKRNGLSGG